MREGHISRDEVMKPINAKAKLGLPLDEWENALFALYGDHSEEVTESTKSVSGGAKFVGQFNSMADARASVNTHNVCKGDKCAVTITHEYVFDGSEWVLSY